MTDFYGILCLRTFWISVEKIQISLKSDKNNGYFKWRPVYVYTSPTRTVLLRMRNISDKICREEPNTQFVFSNIFPNILPFKRQRGKIWKNQRVTHDIICSFPLACWMTKIKNTHSEFLTHWFSTATMVRRNHLNVTFIRTFPVHYFDRILYAQILPFRHIL
jgi:hypothetical protein